MPNYTYDLTTAIGKVRLLIPDRIAGDMRFSDEDILALLDLEEGLVKAAAAAACETLASNKADAAAMVKTYALEVDNAKPAEVLLKRAKMLRDQVASNRVVDEVEAESWDFAFEEPQYP